MCIKKFNEQSEKFLVYCYLDPRKPGKYIFDKYVFDYEPIYIGKGKLRRIKSHLYLYKIRNTRFYSKLESIIKSNNNVLYEVIEDNLSELDAHKLEIKLISLIGRIDDGGTLTNLTIGGEGHSGLKKSEETIRRLSNSLSSKYESNKDIRLNNIINKCKQIHNNKYDYSIVSNLYKNSNSNVEIICPKHGIFIQNINQHSRGQGCPKCAGNKNLSLSEFIDKSNSIHNNKYNYDFVDYVNNSTNVKIICPKHGEFYQKPEYHLSGSGCPMCAGNKKLTLSDFVDKSNIIHNNKYDYSKTEYSGIFGKLVIICPEHGEFIQIAKNHLNGQGCKKCSIEKRKKSN